MRGAAEVDRGWPGCKLKLTAFVRTLTGASAEANESGSRPAADLSRIQGLRRVKSRSGGQNLCVLDLNFTAAQLGRLPGGAEKYAALGRPSPAAVAKFRLYWCSSLFPHL